MSTPFCVAAFDIAFARLSLFWAAKRDHINPPLARGASISEPSLFILTLFINEFTRARARARARDCVSLTLLQN